MTDSRSHKWVLSPLLGREPRLVIDSKGALLRNAYVARCDCGWAYLPGEWRDLPLIGVQPALFNESKVEVRRCRHCNGEVGRPIQPARDISRPLAIAGAVAMALCGLVLAGLILLSCGGAL